MARYNLDSPNHLQTRCDFDAFASWLDAELEFCESKIAASIIRAVCADIDAFVRWPETAQLLWQGCDRVARDGKPIKYHSYPALLKFAAKASKIVLDARPNGPAIAAFLFAGGKRPQRFGSHNGWSIHHLYSGKFHYPGCTGTLHAQKNGDH